MPSSCSDSSTNANLRKPLTLLPGDTEQTSFFRTLLIEEKASVDSLFSIAKRVGPVAKKIDQMESAADASFEDSIQAPPPMLGSTLQGFILLFFVVSYVALTLITCMAVNMITESGTKAAGTFVGFVILAIVLASVIIRFG